MKAINKFIILSILALLLAGCKHSVGVSGGKHEGQDKQKVLLIINPYSYTEARTALPDINWNDYTYELKAIQNPGEATQKPEVTLVNGSTKENLGTGIAIDLGKYKFTLNAYKASERVLTGTVTKDFTSGGNALLSFKMYPVSGSKGSAEITVFYPMGSSVKQIKAAVSKDLFVNPDEAGAVNVSSTTTSGEMKAVFSKTNLSSNTEQYAHLWFYDEAGSVIYTMLESLVIVGGSVSTCERRIESSQWRTYECSVSLKKDGTAWASSGKTVALVDTMMPSIRYNLKDKGNGVFSANVANGTYYIYVNNENTYVELESAKVTGEVNYYTVTAPEAKGCTITAVSGAIESDGTTAVVQKGGNLVFKIEKKEGYKKAASGLVVKVGGTAIADADFDKNIAIENITSAKTITVTGVEAIRYTISYNFDGNEANWKSGYSVPVSFTAEEVVTLPTVADITGDGKLFDAWVDAADSSVVYKTTEGIYNDLKLKATWKDSATVKIINDQGYVFANGLSLIIKANGTATNIYIDLNSNGSIDLPDDYQLEAVDGNKDFTDYILSAGTEDGKEIKSDFKFTMTGGQVRAIYGLDSKDSKRSNKSVLNISGKVKIGKATGVVNKKDSEGNTTTTASLVEGVMLETITSEIINVTGAMDKDSYVYCVTPYTYDANVDHSVAYVGNSIWATYDLFACYTEPEDDETQVYVKNKLTKKDRTESGVKRTVIRLADPAGVALPKPDEIIGDVNLGFSLGDDRVSSECSVFSISVENGVFYMEERLTFTPNLPEGQEKLNLTPEDCSAIESTLTYMVQPTETTYEEELAFRNSDNSIKTYVYMHILSAGNQITPELASDFLSQVKFRRTNDKEVRVKVNLESVPSTDIAAAGVVYFNGSFYKRVAISNISQSNPSSWEKSYNEAKASVFNGLHGYLMNVTSLVENNYIYETFGKQEKQMTYIGGSRLYPTNGKFDSSSFSYQKGTYNGVNYGSNGYNGNYWYWQAGPEAGTPFWYGKTISSATDIANGRQPDGNGGYMYTRWNNKLFDNGSKGAEPNNSGSSEYVVQYLADGNNNGFWNDQPMTNYNADYASKSYIVEYTPYVNQWVTEEAQYQSTTRTASY